MDTVPLRKLLPATAVLAVSLSLVFSQLLLPHFYQEQNVNLDADGNGSLSYNIFVGNGMKYSPGDPMALDRGPVYPYFVALLFRLSGGYSVRIVQLAQALLHGATAILIFLIASKLVSHRAAVLCALLICIHPILIWYTGRIWIETVHAFVLVSAAWALIVLYERLNARSAIVLGFVLGVCCLTKSLLLPFPILLLALLWKRFGRDGLKHGLIVLLVCWGTILPWTFRNYNVAQAFVPVHTSLGFNLVQGDIIGENWPQQWCCNLDFWAKGQARVDSILIPRGIPSFRGVDGDQLLAHTSIQRYLHDPVFFLKRTVANFFLYWSLSESPLKSFVFGLLQWSLVGCATLGYWVKGKSQPLLVPIVGLTLYYIVLHSSIVGWARYSMPIIPLMLLIAVTVIDHAKK